MTKLRVITVNVNGIRAAARKGFFDWLRRQQADVVCLQEIKAQEDQLDDTFYPKGYHCYYFSAEKKGYSGVGIYCKAQPKDVHFGLGWEPMDNEGRYIQADFEDFSVASMYLPSGTSGDARQEVKMRCLDKYFDELKRWKKQKQQLIICGDVNIVHTEQDIKNWKSNQKNSGCLPEERAWLDKIFQGTGYVDSFRELEQAPDQYTWWSSRGNAWDNNVGWRIDYQILSPDFKGKVKATSIYREKSFSDHAPYTVDYVMG